MHAREEEFANRRRSVSEGLSELRVDALVTDRPEHVRYLTGYPVFGASGRPVIVILLSNGELVVIAGGQVGGAVARAVPTARIEYFRAPVPAPGDMVLPEGHLQFAPAAFDSLRRLLAETNVGTVAIDGMNATFPPTTRLDVVLSEFDVMDGSHLLLTLRRIKSPWEIEQLRAAADSVAAAFEAIQPQLRPGMTEIEIQRRMAVAVLESKAALYFASAAVAEDDRNILGPETDREWRPGEALYIDAGAEVEGYTSDFCRTYVAGPVSNEQIAAYQLVVDARDAALAAFKPGVTAGQIAMAMTDVLGNTPEQVAGRMGHGLGMGLEPPSLNPADPTVLVDGSVFCLEPAIVLDGTYYTLEEEYVVAGGELSLISPPAPRQLIVI